MRARAVVLSGLASATLVLAAPQAGAAEDHNSRTYAVPSDQAWIAVTRVAHGMPQWIIVGASEEGGVVTVRKAQRGASLPKPGLRVTVERTGPTATRVTLTRLASRPLDFLGWWADGGELRQFFRELDELLLATDASAPGAL